MRPELRDKIIERLDQAACKAAGTQITIDEGCRIASRVLSYFVSELETMKSRASLQKFFDEMPEPSLIEEKLMLASLRFLPKFMLSWGRQLTKSMEKDFGPIPDGRRPVDYRDREKIVAYVGKLYTQGCSLELSKKRAARHFGVSVGTVQNLWDDRGSIDEADFRSAFKWLTEGIETSAVALGQ